MYVYMYIYIYKPEKKLVTRYSKIHTNLYTSIFTHHCAIETVLPKSIACRKQNLIS